MNKLIVMTLSMIATIVAAEASGQTCPGGYCIQQPAAVRYAPTGPIYYYQPVYRVPVAQPSPAPAPQPAGGGYGAALAVINAERARWGRGPLGWSSWLASYAATNNAVHAPGSSGGAGQCWAGVFDPVQAARMWVASAPHHAILMAATTEIGISNCPTGCTANAR